MHMSLPPIAIVRGPLLPTFDHSPISDPSRESKASRKFNRCLAWPILSLSCIHRNQELSIMTIGRTDSEMKMRIVREGAEAARLLDTNWIWKDRVKK